MGRDGVEAKIGRPAIALAALAFPAGAPPAAGAETRVLQSSDCVMIQGTSHGPEDLKLCGFNGLAINGSGDRLLTSTVRGRVQLWSAEGRVLAEFSNSGGNAGLMFDGDRALFLDRGGTLVVAGGRKGAVIARFAGMPRHGRLERIVADNVLISDSVAGDSFKRDFRIVSLGTGATLARALIAEPRFRVGTEWVAGVTTHRVSPDEWRSTLHLADPALTEVPLDRQCDPIGPRPQCASRPPEGTALHLFDLPTRRWSRLDLGAFAGTTMIDWAQAGGRTFVMACDRRKEKWEAPTESGYGCRVLDFGTGGIVHRFDADRFGFAGGIGPDGAPELRVAAQPREGGYFTLWRIPLNGRAETLGRFGAPTHFSMDGPAGLVWTSRPPSELVWTNGPWSPGELVARRGRARARLDGRFGGCAERMTTWLPHRCRVSGDSRRIAAIENHGLEGRVIWGSIEWRR